MHAIGPPPRRAEGRRRPLVADGRPPGFLQNGFLFSFETEPIDRPEGR